jgi:uncharacterized protein (TIRG00374 family)
MFAIPSCPADAATAPPPRPRARKISQWIVFVFLLAIGLFLLAVLLRYVDVHAVLAAFQSLSFAQQSAVVSFIFVTLAIAAYRWQVILRGFGYRQPFVKLLGFTFRAAAVSFFIPSFEISGETMKALKLARHGVSRPASFASILFDFVIMGGTNIILGLITAGIAVAWGLHSGAWVIVSAVAIICVLVLAVRHLVRRGTASAFILRCIPVNDKTSEEIQLFDYGISFFLKYSRPWLVRAVLLGIAGFAWELVQVYLVLSFLGVSPGVLMVCVFYVAIYFLNGVPVFGGLGFGEIGAFLSGALFGIPDGTSVAVSLLLRMRQIVVFVVGTALLVKDEVQDVRAGER